MTSTTDVSKRLGALIIHNEAPSSQDFGGNMQLLRKLAGQFTAASCRSCRAGISFRSAKEHIRVWIPQARGSQPAQISGVFCKRCQKWTCIGCRGKPTPAKKTISTPVASINHCCDQGRLFGLYILLSRFDEVELLLQKNAAEAQNKRTISKTRAGKGKGTGYALYTDQLDFRYGRLQWHANSADPSQQDDLMDNLFTKLMQLLTAFLPDVRSDSSFDKSPPAELFSLFRMSLLIDRVAALIRNDSIADIGKRAGLYNAVLGFITGIAMHPALVKLLVEKRPDKKHSPGIQSLGESKGPPAFDFDKSSTGMRSSLVSTGMETLKHARIYTTLFNNSALAKDRRTDNDEVAVRICGRLIEFYKLIDRTAPEASSKVNSVARDPWTVFQEKNAVTFTDDVLNRHSLRDRFLSVNHSRPGRMSLMKEIASLSTSLPPGIFLKISETRPDVMKFLIAGVEGSAYEGGLFAFDMYLPEIWPVEPPIVYFVLEGHDSARGGFNPNLHPDGKVCLSLLNTWVGMTPEEMWQPNISTLLSVFVSIQAMILGVSDPWKNEPSAHLLPTSSRFGNSYRLQAEQQVVQYAILYWLNSESAKRSIWYSIAGQYYKHKRKEVLARMEYLQARNPAVQHLSGAIATCLGGSNCGSSTNRNIYRY